MKKAYPIYDQWYHTSLAMIRQYLESFANLQTIGRNGLHRYNNQDHSMLTGIYAARNIAGEQYDVWAVNTEQAYHELSREADATARDRLVPTRVVPVVGALRPAPTALLEVAFAPLDPLALGVAVGTVGGVGLFLATAVLLLQGERMVGPILALLGQYLLGYKVTWSGAFLGLVEAGVGGFMLGAVGAWLRNVGMAAYASLLKRHAEAEAH
jgi:hypothetical protein